MPTRLTQTEFVRRATELHGGKYDYSQVVYQNFATKVEILCPTHGPFFMCPQNHIGSQQQGCRKCGTAERGRRKQRRHALSFASDARRLHGDKYDYSRVVYVSSQTKVEIICPEHGPFWQIPNSHLMRHGCTACGLAERVAKRASTIDAFIERAREAHGEKYDYAQCVYTNCDTPVTIRCPEHGDFRQTPYSHLSGQGCPECGRVRAAARTMTQEEFVEKATALHGERYRYEEVQYQSSFVAVKIHCEVHGPFWQHPNAHLQGQGCKRCSIESRTALRTKSLDEFVAAAKAVHGDKFDYGMAKYVNSKVKVEIVCGRHGPFWQKPNHHLVQKSGCPFCAGKKVCTDNCLATVNPVLATEWHETKNGHLRPTDITATGHQLVWWLCSAGHEWEATINSRRSRPETSPEAKRYTACPACRLQKVVDALSDTHPHVAAEWHPTKNGYSTPDYLTAHHHAPHWWRCPCGEEYEMPVSLRAALGLGCPRCNPGQSILPLSLAALYPEVVSSWHPENVRPPEEVHPGDHTTKYRWLCPDCGSEYTATAGTRVRQARGCPYCSGRRVNHTNSLATIRPDVAAEWHPKANGPLTPHDITANSHKQVWWRCQDNPKHQWRATVHNRIGNDSGCPNCQESRGERAIRQYLKTRGRKCKAQRRVRGVGRFDFLTKTDRWVVIEYHGEQHYRPCAFGSGQPLARFKNLRANLWRDRRKAEWCQDRGIPMLVIPFWDYERIPTLLDGLFAGEVVSVSDPPDSVLKFEPLRQRLLQRFEQAEAANRAIRLSQCERGPQRS